MFSRSIFLIGGSMINQNGCIAALVLSVVDKENHRKVKFTTNGTDKGISVWFSVFPAGDDFIADSIIKITKFEFESVATIKSGEKLYPVTLKVTEWEVIEK